MVSALLIFVEGRGTVPRLPVGVGRVSTSRFASPPGSTSDLPRRLVTARWADEDACRAPPTSVAPGVPGAPVTRTASRARTYALAALFGLVVGAMAAVFVLVMRLLTDLLWDGSQARLPGPAWLGTAILLVFLPLGALLPILVGVASAAVARGVLGRRSDGDPHEA